MLLFVYLSYVLRSPAIAQQLSCRQATLQSSQSPGVSNIVFDTEPAFVYEDTDCRSTDQKIVGLDALSPDICGPAIYAICGATNVTQQWTWAWSSSSTGYMSSWSVPRWHIRTPGLGMLSEEFLCNARCSCWPKH